MAPSFIHRQCGAAAAPVCTPPDGLSGFVGCMYVVVWMYAALTAHAIASATMKAATPHPRDLGWKYSGCRSIRILEVSV